MAEDKKDHEPSVIRKGRELKYAGTVIDVYDDTVIANGIEAHWDFIHHDGAACVVALTDEGKLLMVRQFRNALDREILEVPAGKLKSPDEPKIECAARELTEETGFSSDDLEYLCTVNTTVAFCDESIDIFLARHLTPASRNLDPDEVINVEEWDLDDLKDLIYSGEITDAKTIAAILAYSDKYAKKSV